MTQDVHWFYVLYSLKDHKLYKGSCSEPLSRYFSHINGRTLSTKRRRPLVLIYLKKFDSKSDALHFERYSKTLEGGSQLKADLIRNGILNASGRLSSDG